VGAVGGWENCGNQPIEGVDVTTIKLSYADLTALADNLKVVLDEFQNAKINAHDAAGLVGDGRLAACVEDFTARWLATLDELAGSLTSLQDTVATVVASFSDADRQLQCSLGEASPPPREPVNFDLNGGILRAPWLENRKPGDGPDVCVPPRNPDGSLKYGGRK